MRTTQSDGILPCLIVVLKPDGVMTVMFTHKAAGAWDALATGLIEGELLADSGESEM
jgi:hypothetical protein